MGEFHVTDVEICTSQNVDVLNSIEEKYMHCQALKIEILWANEEIGAEGWSTVAQMMRCPKLILTNG